MKSIGSNFLQSITFYEINKSRVVHIKFTYINHIRKLFYFLNTEFSFAHLLAQNFAIQYFPVSKLVFQYLDLPNVLLMQVLNFVLMDCGITMQRQRATCVWMPTKVSINIQFTMYYNVIQ